MAHVLHSSDGTFGRIGLRRLFFSRVWFAELSGGGFECMSVRSQVSRPLLLSALLTCQQPHSIDRICNRRDGGGETDRRIRLLGFAENRDEATEALSRVSESDKKSRRNYNYIRNEDIQFNIENIDIRGYCVEVIGLSYLELIAPCCHPSFLGQFKLF